MSDIELTIAENTQEMLKREVAFDINKSHQLIRDAVASASRRHKAVRDVIVERGQQIAALGFDNAQDDALDRGELAIMGACYAFASQRRFHDVAHHWPFYRAVPSSYELARTHLVKAAASILAEIERLDRAADRARLEKAAELETKLREQIEIEKQAPYWKGVE